MPTLMLMLGLLLVLLPALLLLARRHRELARRDEPSPIHLQHIELIQGGRLNEAAVESAKLRFRELLERGEVDAVEANMRAGMNYVVQVRALTELGTEDAGRILERQLTRKLTDDPIEQAWYWIDLANGLRALNRPQSLPHLLRTAERAGDIPLGHVFAAETICFLGFAGYVRQSRTSLGKSATRVMLRTLEGLRYGLPAVVVLEGRLGELVETLWDNLDGEVDPLSVRVFSECLRLLQRAPHFSRTLDDAGEQEAFEWQMSRVAVLEPAMEEYLADAHAPLRRRLADAEGAERKEVLLALADLRAEAGAEALPLLTRPDFPYAEAALEVLTWSRDPRVGPALCEFVLANVKLLDRARKRPQAAPSRKPTVPPAFPYRAILRALRRHPGEQTEALLILAARDFDPTFRSAAVGSLGWWEPLVRGRVPLTLEQARRDPNPEVRQAARSALARLGERQALLWFRQSLSSEDTARVHEAIQTIAAEEITLLWPDLDRLADAENAEIAQQAREALERMGEWLGRGW